MTLFRISFFAVLFSSAGSLLAQAAAPPANSAIAESARAPLIPISEFATRDIFSHARMSPDGQSVAVFVPREGGPMVAVLGSDTGARSAQIVLGGDLEYNWHRWAGSRTVLVSVAQLMPVLGEETRVSRLVAIDVTTGAQWFVGPKRMGVEGDDLLHVADDGSSVLLAFQESVYNWPAVHRISLLDRKDQGEEVQRPVDGIWEWFADDAGVVRMGTGWQRSKLRVTYRKSEADRFREIARIGEGEEDKLLEISRIVSGSDEGFVLDEAEDGRVVLKRFNLATREPIETIYRNDAWDVTEAWLDDKGKPVAVDYTDDRDRRVWLEPEMAKLQKGLEKALQSDEVWIGSRSSDDNRMLVFAGGETDPGSLYVYDAAKRELKAFAIFRPTLDLTLLARPRPVFYSARDGTKISGYLTLPRGRSSNLPLIILPHGGPYGVRDKLTYDDQVQFLANRGYAVLQPNYRGSEGYGTKFEDLGTGQIGRAMQDDLDDAMDWAVKQGIADAGRVCVVGASYGGYAAMWAAIRNPERYRCAASFAGVTDWRKMLRYDAKFFSRKGAKKWKSRVAGDADFDLDSVSSADTIDRLKVPLLVAHGRKDTNVPFSQFKAIQSAASKYDKPIETLIFDDVGHGFETSADEARWLSTLEGFLQRHNPAD